MDDLKKNAIAKFREVFRKVDIQYTNFAKKLGINYAAVCVMECISESVGLITQKEICERLVLPKQLVNTIIKSFWEQGLVELKEAKDRRNKVIILTDAGKKYADTITAPLQYVDFMAWDCFTTEEIKIFIKLIERYEVSIERAVNDFIEYET